MNSEKNQEDFYGKNYKERKKERKKVFFLLALLTLILPSCSWQNNSGTYIKISLPAEESGRSVLKDATIEGKLTIERVSASDERLDEKYAYQKEIDFSSSAIKLEIPGGCYYNIGVAVTVTQDGKSEKYYGTTEEFIVANAANTVNLECQKIITIKSYSTDIDDCRTFNDSSETFTLTCAAKHLSGDQLYFHAYEVTLNSGTSIAQQLASQLENEYATLIKNPTQITNTIADWAGWKDDETNVCSWSKTFSENTTCYKYYVIVVHTIDTDNLESSFEDFAFTNPIKVHLYQNAEN